MKLATLPRHNIHYGRNTVVTFLFPAKIDCVSDILWLRAFGTSKIQRHISLQDNPEKLPASVSDIAALLF